MYAFKPGDSFYYFEVMRVLGAGAHGAVYEIRHRETGDSFALKTMHAADSVDPNKTARALVAAKGNYRIDHRNVVKVLDLNCEPSGLVWMRTEMLRGHTIQELVARQGRLSLPFALAVAVEAAAGLAALHEAQIIHRDVKPSNLFYTEGRAVKVLDLSLAKVFPEGLETTIGGRLGLGTPAYSAPEQLEGLVRPDVRFDVYGLGITLWETLAGRHPYANVLNNVAELIKRQLTVMPAPLSEVAGLPPEVDAVVRKAIAKDPSHRFSSMMEMARALMDLGAWVAAEAQARRVALVTPHGEPALPGDANTWRDYRPPEATPEHFAPPSGPRERVILGTPTPPGRLVRVPQKLAATLPLEPGGGPSSTPPVEGAVGVETVRNPRAGAHSASNTSWAAVIAAGALLSLASVALVVWLLGRRTSPVDPTPAEIPLSPLSADLPAPLAPATLQIEPTPAPPPTPASANGQPPGSPSAASPSASQPGPRHGPARPSPAPPPPGPRPSPTPTSRAIFRVEP